MNSAWVDHWLGVLMAPAGAHHPPPWSLFAPTSAFYCRLMSGEQQDLESALAEVGHHVGLVDLPTVEIEWGIRMAPEHAGEIRIADESRSHIRVPLTFVGRPHALGAILAHELSHEHLSRTSLHAAGPLEEEQITDLAAIALGFGRLMLNGILVETTTGVSAQAVLGYLRPDLMGYAYKSVNRTRRIDDAVAREFLTAEALQLIS